ncbi:MAG: M1 family aminopeptidase [Terriglobales bacterium]
MPYRTRWFCVAVVVCLSAISASSYAQTAPGAAPNSDATYQQLRNIGLSAEAVTVNNFELKRDAATFLLRSGTVCFVAPVQGRVTGAVFVGDGNMTLDPPSPGEAVSLKRLTKEDKFSEDFSRLALRFTDSTYDQIKKGGTPASGGCDAGLLEDSQHTTRKKLNYNLSARILQDLLNAQQGGLFVAFVHGKHYDDKLMYFMDPDGAPGVAPEQVELTSYGENKSGTWASFNFSSEYRDGLGAGGEPNSRIHIEHQELDTTIEKSAHLTGKAITTFVSESSGLRVVGLSLFPTLRVDSVKAEDGQPVSFIQEDKNDDPDFYVILAKPLSKGDKFTITTTYNGKDAVLNEGSGNYYPIAREDWYPSKGGGLGDYTNFDMTFRIPKGMKMAATGSLLSESNDGSQNVTVWRSDIAQPLAGFQFGRMKEEDAKLTSPDFLVAAYANEEPPDWADKLRGGTMGNLSTVSMMKQPLSEAQYAIGLYTGYFGPLPFKRLNITQQTACTYGQSWPGLVWLPICSFYDVTVRHQLGLDFSDNIYWKVVTPHEVAHQWWGQTVGFESYRDQWMSEGFADFSASLFLQSAYGKNGQKEFLNFWDEERKSLTERNADGFRAIDVGPVTMGYRSSNSKTGNIGSHLIYPKGAYILHMVRMMLWDRQDGDQNFKELMQDFVKTYGGRAATTEDFKAMVEKHMNAQMKSFGDGTMDWFFNEYVYGTALPSYRFETASFDTDANGDVVFNVKLTQSGVDNNFRMLVPIYIELASGNIYFLGRARLVGNSSFEQKIPLKGLKDKPHRAIVNYYDDVLASSN